MSKHIHKLTTTVLTLTGAALNTLLTAPRIFAQNAGGFERVDAGMLNAVDPLQFSSKREQLNTPGGIINELLTYAFPLAGLILFVMIVWGGFEILYNSAGKNSLDAGKQRITSALIGFTLLFVSYWVIRLIEEIFQINIITTGNTAALTVLQNYI